jgi:hypothetical protein
MAWTKLLWPRAQICGERNAVRERNWHRQRSETFTGAPIQLPSASCHPSSRETRFVVTRRPDFRLDGPISAILPIACFESEEAVIRRIALRPPRVAWRGGRALKEVARDGWLPAGVREEPALASARILRRRTNGSRRPHRRAQMHRTDGAGS